MLPKEEIRQFIFGFIIIGFVFGAILRILGSRIAGHALFLLLIFMLAFPFLWELLPFWVTLLFMAFIALVFLQAMASLIIGKSAADTMVGNLAADLVRFLVRVLILPVEIVRRILRIFNNPKT